MYRQCDQDEEDILMVEDEKCVGAQKLADPDELSFTWFLIKLMEQIRKFWPPNCASFKRQNFFYHAQLLLIFIMFLVAIVAGAVFLNQCNTERMICIFLIVHGVCGIIVVLVHMIAAFIG